MPNLIEVVKAVLYGIVEGITEWLPIISTGHLILLASRFPFTFSSDAAFLREFWETFEVVIQLGAVAAVLVLYRKILLPFGKSRVERTETYAIWGKIFLACLPAALIGLTADTLLENLTGKDLEDWLYTPLTVALCLIAYGIAFILFDRVNKPNLSETVSTKQALGIGLFQSLSLIPGTSRSGSTMLGASFCGVERKSGAEFSFFMAIPIMFGASSVKIFGFTSRAIESGFSVPTQAVWLLGIGCGVSFAVSLIGIRFFVRFVSRHTLFAFGVYRIALGLLVLILSR